MSQGTSAAAQWIAIANELEADAALTRQRSRERFEAETQYAAAGGGGVQDYLERRERGGESLAMQEPLSQPVAPIPR